MPRKKKSVPAPEAPPLRLEWRSPAELAENPRNWRRHPETQVAALSDVLGEVGWAGACLFNERTGRLIDGHARRKVALQQGAASVPVLVGSWDEAAEAKILATLDPLGAMATADAAALESLLQDVQTGSQAVTDMLSELATEAGIATAEEPAADPGPQLDRAAELREKWGTAAGQLWVIPSAATPGKSHRLLCGDSTKAEDVARVMGGEKADLCFTSPPYDQQRQYEGGIGDWLTLMKGVFANLPMAVAGQVLVNLGLIHREGEWVPYWEPWVEWMRGEGWRRFGWYVWDQGFGLPGDWQGRLASSHEWVFHFNREAVKPEKFLACTEENLRREESDKRQNANGSRPKGMRGADGVVKPRSSLERNSHKIADSVLRINRHMANDVARQSHPATFPPELPAFAIKCWPGLCYDPFLGSGTTLVAAEQTGRLACGIEISPAYVAVALERLAGMGLEPSLTSGA